MRGFDCSEKSLEIVKSWGEKRTFAAETLEKIRADLGDCRRCKLCETRKNIVFGAGNFRAGLVFVGEARDLKKIKKAFPLWARPAGYSPGSSRPSISPGIRSISATS